MKHIANFVSKIATHFPPPKFESAEQEQEWLRGIVESLKRYDPALLDRAAQKIIDTRGLRDGERWFPIPAAIHRVCADLIEFDKRKELPIDGDNGQHPYSWGRRKLALDLMRGEMGRTAVAEGWGNALFDWICENARLPSPTNRVARKTLERNAAGKLVWQTFTATEVECCRMEAAGADQAYAMAVRGGWVFAPMVAAMGETMLTRREVIADHVTEVIDLRDVRMSDVMAARVRDKAAEQKALRQRAATESLRQERRS